MVNLAGGFDMKYLLISFLLIACLVSPLFAVAEIELWLTVDIINASTSDVNIYAKSTGSDLTQIDGVQWAIAYNTAENTPSLTLINDFAGDWTPAITNQPASIGSYDEMISWIGNGGIDKTISGSSGGTLLATVRFSKAGSNWGTVHIVTEGEDASYGTIITNNAEQKSLAYPLPDQSLPVQMTEMKATASAKEGIVLTWTTESEVNSAGFYVWRSETENGKYQRLSTGIIAGQGNSSSQSGYRFSDPNAMAGKTYWYKIESVSTDGKSEFHGSISVQGAELVPDKFALSQNYPNPFNPETKVDYDLPDDSRVMIRVFTMLGKKVKTLVDQSKQAGEYSVSWDGTDSQGLLVPSGIYFMKMQAGNYSFVRKMTFIR
jgi:hypothetical protein